MITISVCMIVKNEEQVLRRGLDSLKGIYDELIIVDTGSSDRTKEIASEYTDKIYDFKWIDDFAAARNYLFSKATMDYIYIADADEVLEPFEREKFLQLKQVLLPEIEIVQMHYANQLEFNTTYNFDMEYRPKLYKRLRSFVWTDPLHESVVLEPVVYDSDIIISHRPTHNHGSRDFALFERVVQKEGNLSKKLRKMYGRELYITGTNKDFLASYKYFQRIASEITDPEELSVVYPILMRCARLQNDLLALLSYSTKALAGDITSSELCYELGELYYMEKQYHEAMIWFYNAAFQSESVLNIAYQKKLPLSRLAECYSRLDSPDDENYYRDLAKQYD